MLSPDWLVKLSILFFFYTRASLSLGLHTHPLFNSCLSFSFPPSTFHRRCVCVQKSWEKEQSPIHQAENSAKVYGAPSIGNKRTGDAFCYYSAANQKVGITIPSSLLKIFFFDYAKCRRCWVWSPKSTPTSYLCSFPSKKKEFPAPV